MAIETDETALTNAMSMGMLESDDKSGLTDNGPPHAMFFIYMRLNSDGTFAAYQYYFEGTDIPIDPSVDPNVPHSLGFYARDMAKYARPSSPDDGRYKYYGRELEGFQFPQRISYCVMFMDDLHWKFLEDNQGLPVITFNDKKLGKPYHKHKHAFKRGPLLNLEMPIAGTNNTDVRQAAVMINRMRNKNDKVLGSGEKEDYNFDLWMRVRYPNSTNGLTLIIDPGGTNLGPPVPPPAVP